MEAAWDQFYELFIQIDDQWIKTSSNHETSVQWNSRCGVL